MSDDPTPDCGHDCCPTPNDPSHDHFLGPDECPACIERERQREELQAEADRLAIEVRKAADDPTPDLRALAQAATRGPWTTAARYGWAQLVTVKTDPPQPICSTPRSDQATYDAAYIAAVSPDVILALLDRLDEYEKVHGTEVAQVAARLTAETESRTMPDLTETSAALIVQLQVLADEYGARGVVDTMAQLYPGCVPEPNPSAETPAPLTTVTPDLLVDLVAAALCDHAERGRDAGIDEEAQTVADALGAAGVTIVGPLTTVTEDGQTMRLEVVDSERMARVVETLIAAKPENRWANWVSEELRSGSHARLVPTTEDLA